MPYMADPTQVLRDYLRGLLRPNRRERGLFEAGRLAMGLEVMTVLKNLDGIPITSELGRAETESVLHTLLVQQELLDISEEWYDRLAEWRKPKFRPEPSPGPWPVRIGGAGASASLQHRGQSAGSSSEPVELRDVTAPRGIEGGPSPGRQSLDDDPTLELKEPHA